MCRVSAKFAKLLLFVINIIVWLCGMAILGVGISLTVSDFISSLLTNVPSDMNDSLYAVACYMMIGVGSVLFLVGFLGCCGTCKGSVCLLQSYIICVSVLILAEVTGAILAIVLKNEFDKTVKDGMRNGLEKDYPKDTKATSKAFDAMQSLLKCCGAYDFKDYKLLGLLQTDPVPISCCARARRDKYGNMTIATSDKNECMEEANNVTTSFELLYDQGCYDALWTWMGKQANIIIGVLVGLVFVQIFGLITACCIKTRLKDVSD